MNLEVISPNKMLKINESSLDDIYANDDRTFNFKLTDKKAKSNLWKSANIYDLK